ncbi:NAD(P)-dependent alcohol dehydrogenase [Caulobacter vibrioides]|uniref:NAD(P)-dependent alcohol dehydrogenase n=1 Tax=Caulobacter vibrioides TaxID=155892 RepID=UPI000BB4AE19|nr:NAD(P)-dependent alcohol dehydrogenase [Caulobacter vibrioides]ATC25355.1 NAD(P)-dependent alcohol dehydrogenase [Caulobacter vibrioides]AZH13446.1 NAD(P)-dependent alcohol dehydrogenase [Caulobacter vibrioides]PLR14121.1 NAD(P)-dependent alcohol dehydrogenase [Caulobacter vibrioides]
MKAVTCRRYGSPDVLAIETLERPKPRRDEVLVRVANSTVTSGDTRLRGFRGPLLFWLPLRLAFGVFRPRQPITGMEFAGDVVGLGSAVKGLRPGDRVFGMKLGGANAEYVTVKATAALARCPDRLSDDQCAATPFGALSALTFVRDTAELRPGERILIYGASGAVGVFAIQLAKILGAHVTAVCSARNLQMVLDLGADRALDYAAPDFRLEAEAYDVILDTVGATRFSQCRHALGPTGRHVFAEVDGGRLLQSLWTSFCSGPRVLCGFSAGDSPEDMSLIARHLDRGVLRPVIDRRYTMAQIIEAHRYVELGRKRGAVVIRVAD